MNVVTEDCMYFEILKTNMLKKKTAKKHQPTCSLLSTQKGIENSSFDKDEIKYRLRTDGKEMWSLNNYSLMKCDRDSDNFSNS